MSTSPSGMTIRSLRRSMVQSNAMVGPPWVRCGTRPAFPAARAANVPLPGGRLGIALEPADVLDDLGDLPAVRGAHQMVVVGAAHQVDRRALLVVLGVHVGVTDG